MDDNDDIVNIVRYAANWLVLRAHLARYGLADLPPKRIAELAARGQRVWQMEEPDRYNPAPPDDTAASE